MTTFVLIHGAYHGGWCWSRVASRLRAKGHDVHRPTLAGMGEHAHLLSRQITLDTHVDDVVSHIETEELENVLLVGHSYGGLIITGAADRLDGSGKIASLVYLDALAPVDGSRWSDFNLPAAAEARHASAKKAGGLFMPPPDAAMFGLTDAADIAWGNRRLRPHPYGCYQSFLRLPNLAAGRGAARLALLWRRRRRM
jgi:pimeloyl-ACP methyl ester carboxylesterase